MSDTISGAAKENNNLLWMIIWSRMIWENPLSLGEAEVLLQKLWERVSISPRKPLSFTSWVWSTAFLGVNEAENLQMSFLRKTRLKKTLLAGQVTFQWSMLSRNGLPRMYKVMPRSSFITNGLLFKMALIMTRFAPAIASDTSLSSRSLDTTEKDCSFARQRSSRREMYG